MSGAARRRAAKAKVFAVEDTAAQVTWRTTTDGGPAAAAVDGLRAGVDNEVTVTAPGGQPEQVTVRTLVPPPGAELFRFATMNDLHFGERSFGFFRTMREPASREPYPTRCARAALAEALEWGAKAIVLKGDITNLARPSQWRIAAEVFGDCPVPVLAVRGNHDLVRTGVNGRRELAAAGIRMAEEPTAHDFPGIRIVLGQSAVPGHGHGRVEAGQRDRLAELCAAVTTGCFVAVHHQTQPLPVRLYHPPGIPGPQARALLDALGEANPAVVFASGHTHRHRRRTRGPVVVTEVGSPKDYPGTWGGYVVHEGGIRQVVRRIAAPDVIAWTEYTRRAVLGVWGLWSPGSLADRCWSHTWPTRS